VRTIPLLTHLDLVAAAVAERDVAKVKELVTGQGSSRIPRRVREEVLTVATLPRTSLRAPMALFAFYYQTSQLMRDEAEVAERERSQLELPLARRKRRKRTA
jgi:hypothetical protein